MRADDISTANQVWSKAEHFRQGLGLLAISGEEPPSQSRIQNWAFWSHFFWRFSEMVEFGRREMGLSGSYRVQLEVPAEQTLVLWVPLYFTSSLILLLISIMPG